MKGKRMTEMDALQEKTHQGKYEMDFSDLGVRIVIWP